MINFAIPGLDNHFHIFQQLIQIKKDFPYMFYEDININAFYGNFHYCIWDGGRVFHAYHQKTSNEVYEISNFLKNNGISLRLIFTNPVVEKKHLDDRFCNLVAEMCEHENNEIVINSPLLEDYLRNKYPKYGFISSTTKCNNKDSSFEELNKNYKYICLDYNLNKNYNFLESIPKEQRNKIEFLVNAICPPGCPNRKRHYDLNGYSHLNLVKQYSIDCGIKENTLAATTINFKNNIQINEIYNYYINEGYNNFKIESRSLPDFELVGNFARYLIKSEHQFHFMSLFFAHF